MPVSDISQSQWPLLHPLGLQLDPTLPHHTNGARCASYCRILTGALTGLLGLGFVVFVFDATSWGTQRLHANLGPLSAHPNPVYIAVPRQPLFRQRQQHHTTALTASQYPPESLVDSKAPYLASVDQGPGARVASTNKVSAESIADALDQPSVPLRLPPVPSLALLLSGLTVLLSAFHLRHRPGSSGAQGTWSMAAVGQEEEVDRKQTEASPTANETPVVLEKKPWPVAVWDAIRSVRVDFVLLAYLAVWYFGNFKSNISNKLALAGGTQECPFLVGTAEMLVGVLYALFLWGVPDARKLPKIKRSDVVALMPLTVCTLGHQFATVYATSAGSLSSVQILKATEPVFAAVFANFFYGKTVSRAKWLCLIPIIGGVALSSFNEISFSWLACGCVIISNIFSAVRSNEHRKAMDTEGLKDRLGSVGNQFAIVYCLCFLLGLPLSLLKEGHLVPHFLTTLAESPDTLGHIVSAGLWFYIYNEVSTMVVKRTGALTQSVLNTAKRVIVIVGASIVLGEGLAPMKILGCAIGIGGVFLYSAVGKFNPPADSKPKAAAAV